jgi:hypothetical protein
MPWPDARFPSAPRPRSTWSGGRVTVRVAVRGADRYQDRLPRRDPGDQQPSLATGATTTNRIPQAKASKLTWPPLFILARATPRTRPPVRPAIAEDTKPASAVAVLRVSMAVGEARAVPAALIPSMRTSRKVVDDGRWRRSKVYRGLMKPVPGVEGARVRAEGGLVDLLHHGAAHPALVGLVEGRRTMAPARGEWFGPGPASRRPGGRPDPHSGGGR